MKPVAASVAATKQRTSCRRFTLANVGLQRPQRVSQFAFVPVQESFDCPVDTANSARAMPPGSASYSKKRRNSAGTMSWIVCTLAQLDTQAACVLKHGFGGKIASQSVDDGFGEVVFVWICRTV